MSWVDSRGLGPTLDGIEHRLERGAKPRSKSEASEAAAWLLARQQRRGRGAGMFEPLRSEFGRLVWRRASA